MFDQLQFEAHQIPGAIQARHKFSNDWSISVVSGLPGSGLYGNVTDNTYEVAIFRPNGNMTEDVIGWNTKDEVKNWTRVGLTPSTLLIYQKKVPVLIYCATRTCGTS